jgi:hypothetical protein
VAIHTEACLRTAEAAKVYEQRFNEENEEMVIHCDEEVERGEGVKGKMMSVGKVLFKLD